MTKAAQGGGVRSSAPYAGGWQGRTHDHQGLALPIPTVFSSYGQALEGPSLPANFLSLDSLKTSTSWITAALPTTHKPTVSPCVANTLHE